MNTLLWLWDVLVRERRLNRFSEAVNAAYEHGCERGYHQAINDMKHMRPDTRLRATKDA